MNRLELSVLHIARFTLEAETGLSIGSGGSDGVYDHPIVRDANDLPTIPGSSLAGVLRHLWIDQTGEASANDLFGYQDSNQGARSRIEVATCALQDSRGCPVEGLLIDQEGRQRLLTDRLLSGAVATKADPLFRDRVRIGHRGAAADTGKFDRGLLAAGHRFSGEIRFWSSDKQDPDWDALLGLLADPRLRLGGATRAGLGAMSLVTLHCGSFDLRELGDITAFQNLGIGLADTGHLTARTIETLPRPVSLETLTLELTPRDFWRFGQGNRSLKANSNDKIPDLLPKVEPVVSWIDGRAEIATRMALVPASSIKGALAHRTAFHWNAMNDRFVDDLSVDEIKQWDKSEHCDGVKAIFGHAKDHDRGDPGDSGRSGLVLIDDISIEMPEAELQRHLQTMIHNSLDRFSGGVRNRMLFTEELIYRRPIRLGIRLLPPINGVDVSARKAFARAIRDLCEGRLALGAGVTKGHGSFTGTVDASTEAWLDAQEEGLQ